MWSTPTDLERAAQAERLEQRSRAIARTPLMTVEARIERWLGEDVASETEQATDILIAAKYELLRLRGLVAEREAR